MTEYRIEGWSMTIPRQENFGIKHMPTLMDFFNIEDQGSSDPIDPERNIVVMMVWMVVFISLLVIHTRYTIMGICR